MEQEKKYFSNILTKKPAALLLNDLGTAENQLWQFGEAVFREPDWLGDYLKRNTPLTETNRQFLIETITRNVVDFRYKYEELWKNLTYLYEVCKEEEKLSVNEKDVAFYKLNALKEDYRRISNGLKSYFKSLLERKIINEEVFVDCIVRAYEKSGWVYNLEKENSIEKIFIQIDKLSSVWNESKT